MLRKNYAIWLGIAAATQRAMGLPRETDRRRALLADTQLHKAAKPGDMARLLLRCACCAAVRY